MTPDADIAERCAAVARAVQGEGDLDAAALDAAVADLRLLPADLPVCGPLAGGLIVRVLKTNLDGGLEPLRHLDTLLEIADRHPPATPDWPRHRSAARTMVSMRAIGERRLTDPQAALAELDQLPDGPAGELVKRMAGMAFRHEQAVQNGDEAAVRRMAAEIEEIREQAAAFPELKQSLDLRDLAYDLMAAQERGDDPTIALRRLREATSQLPPGHHLRTVVDDAAKLLVPYAQLIREPASAPSDDLFAAVGELAARPGLAPTDQAFYLAGAGMFAFGQGSEPGQVDAGIERLREALRLLPPEHPKRAFYLGGLALGLFRRNDLGGPFADIREAAVLLEEACALAGGPHHPQWSMLNEMLSDARRRLPGSTDPGRHALEGLRGYAWKALVQSDLTAAKAAVRDAARDAVDIARHCLVDGDPAEAIRALDAGRGLALFAATQTRDVAERLDRVGRAGLARRWRAASAEQETPNLPAELRAEVWKALSAADGAIDLLDSPSLGEIREALVTLDADALVYLVPADGVVPGYAVVAPVGGPPGYLALPFLRAEADLDVERYLTALARRDSARDLAPVDAESGFSRTLDELCDWAWRAAIGPLVEQGLPRLTRPHPTRVPRVVLVPMGELARVPWQAARRADGRYAVQQIAISQAASARMLCHSAALTRVPVSPLGLVVGDPDTDLAAPALRSARLEAYAVQRSFYRGARYVGRRLDGSASPSGRGSADEIRDWLTTAAPGAGAMLHLACHGVVQADATATTSYLLLAGGDRLPAEELIELMGRAPERDVGLIVLAACRTGLSISGYDEAYSLGTALLAGGVRSVLSAQWAIPDRATSVLMFMFHHHLVARGLPPWQALREAQLWMLDPNRRLDMLPPALRGQLTDADPADVVAWAGIVHWGQ